jgi:phosphomannomutase
VALDSVNGAGSLLSVAFLRDSLNCDLHAIAVDPTKPFSRIAEPRPDTLDELAELVRRNQCDAGFAQDPDADRLAVVDETGRVLDNDDVLALMVDAVLARRPGNVVVNLTTSWAIDDVASRYNCAVWRTPVGEANVVERMREVGAVIGGEGSNGGIIFPPVQLCRDSYVGMAFLLDGMASAGKRVSELAARLPRYTRRFGKMPFEHGRLGPLMQSLERAFPGGRVDRTDGLKIALSDRWIHVRASNTEPILRLAVEARSESDAGALFQQLMSLAALAPHLPPPL